MSATSPSDIRFEIGHVLFIDIVGYSKLMINEQSEQIRTLREIVRGTEQFRLAEAEGKLLRLPTGDGSALVFRNSTEAPVLCALEISEELRNHLELHVRMGIHSGPVNEVTDLNEQANIAGAGINIAQRVMDCGDAGHILLSRHVAEDLEHYPRWRCDLHELGECEVKHGVRVSVVNLYTAELGNPQVPEKLRNTQQLAAQTQTAPTTRSKRSFVALGIFAASFLLISLAILALIFAPAILRSRNKTANDNPASGNETATKAIPEKSVAVLPFKNLSDDKSNAYFADGIQEEILTRLAKIADLKVISRTSTQRYQSNPGNLGEIAKQLGVANILEGSVQKAADQVRVNVQLINAQTDSHLWAETYDRKLTDIFGVESEIAKGIADSLRAKLTGREKQALVVKPTNNLEAYDAYLRGLAFEARSNSILVSAPLSLKAIGFYERAVQLDPNFALAWARLSRMDSNLYFNRIDTTTAARGDAAKSALENAQKLEPNSPETLLALGYYQYWVLRDYGAAKTTFGRVSKMLPGSSEVPRALGTVARREGHWDESIAYFEQALALDPRNAELLSEAAWTYEMLRQFSTALKLYDRALDIMPNDPGVMAIKARIYQAQGHLQEAARLLPAINGQTPTEETFSDGKIFQLRLERNLGEAVRLLQARLTQFHFGSQFDKASDQLWLALMQRHAGDTAGAKVTAEQARNTLEQLYRDQPDNALLAANLSLAYAAMGEKGSALEEAERATILLPRAKDSVSGPSYEENLAVIQTMFGENSRAISTLTQLLQTPYARFYGPEPITPALLRLDPIWDPLRADPAFQKLCQDKAK